MVSHIRVLSEDEKVRLQCQAREDYEHRMADQYNRGRIEILKNLIKKNASKSFIFDLEYTEREYQQAKAELTHSDPS